MLAVKLETTHKPAKSPTNHLNYPQTSQTTHKLAKPCTNHPQTRQTTLKPAKYQRNHPVIGQKSHCFLTEDIFYEPQHFPCPSHARREMDAFFLMFLLDFAFRLLHCTIL